MKLFQVNMTFKQITDFVKVIDLEYIKKIIKCDKTWYLTDSSWLFNSTNHSLSVITLDYIYINKNSIIMYENVFKTFFDLIKEITEKKIKWKYINESEIKTIIADMCSKQASDRHYFILMYHDNNW